jgi:predicted Zn-dependent protease
MPALTSIALWLCFLISLASCTQTPSIDSDGNVTVKQPSKIMQDYGTRQFNYLKNTKKISSDPSLNKRVIRVASKLQAVIDLPEAKWEFVVFEDNSLNAFCLPGGKVGINTGLFRIIGDDDALLAAALGHEISHATANHAQQRIHRMLRVIISSAIIWRVLDHNDIDNTGEIISAFSLGGYVFNTLPFYRMQEYESDKMGAIFMAKAGYDPRKSILLWKLLKSRHFYDGDQKPEFLRTHPHDIKRIKALEYFMPIAMQHYYEAKKSDPKRNQQ